MSQVTGVPKVTYAVFDETINQWAWFWIEGLRGTLEEAVSDGIGNRRYEIFMGDFIPTWYRERTKPGQSKILPKPLETTLFGR